MPGDIKNVDIEVEVVEGAIQSDYWCVFLLLNGKYSLIRHWERYQICLYFSDFPSKNAIDLENSFFLIEMDCFNSNEIILIRIFFLIKYTFFLIKTKCFFKQKEL